MTKIEREDREKQVSFKFCKRTVNNIQALINMGLVRNRTEAIDLAIEHLVTEETTKSLRGGGC